MRTAIAFILALLILASCQREIDFEETQTNTRTTGQAKYPKLTINTVYDTATGAVANVYYTKFDIDSNGNTITATYDTIHNQYLKYYYDDAGKLLRIEGRDSTGTDQVLFGRSGNRITWETPYSVQAVTITDLPNNQKEVKVDPVSPATGNHFTITLNREGLVTHIIDSNTHPTNPGYLPGFTGFAYNNQGKLDSIEGRTLYVNGQDSIANSGKTYFTKDNQPNEHLLEFCQKLLGPDLQWILHIDYSAWFQIIFPYDGLLSDRLFLSQGSIIETKGYSSTTSKLGGIVRTETTHGDITRNMINYDAQGKIVKLKRTRNNKQTLMVEIFY